MPKLKYEDKIKELKNCPSKKAAEQELIAYRWVKNPITSECFNPVAIKTPKRVLRSESEKCSSYALSMYNLEEKSIVAFKDLEKVNPKIRKTLGGWIAKGFIKKQHGLCTAPNPNNGHFDLYEYTELSIIDSFNIYMEIEKNHD